MAINDIEFIRYLIDLISEKNAQKSVGEPAPTVIINIDKNGEVGSHSDENVEDVDNPMDRDDVFIPPLQAKIEMMKKMTGVEPKNQDMMSSEDDEPFDG